MKPSMKQKYFDILFWSTAIVLCFMLLGLPGMLPNEGRQERSLHEHESGQQTIDEKHEEQLKREIHEELKAQEQDKLPELQEVKLRPVARLTLEEEDQLKRTDYNTYIRYKAQLENPSRLESVTKEEIITKRLAPKLLDQLAKNREVTEAP